MAKYIKIPSYFFDSDKGKELISLGDLTFVGYLKLLAISHKSNPQYLINLNGLNIDDNEISVLIDRPLEDWLTVKQNLINLGLLEIKNGNWYIKKYWEVSRVRNSPEYRQWRTNVFNRDNFKCVICNKVGGELEAHHIKHWSVDLAGRFDVDNGITVCKECHKTIHKEDK